MQAPKQKPIYQVGISDFRGVDLRNAPQKVAEIRSPNCINMIRETVGNNRKRRGYETLFTLEGSINGFHTLKTLSGDKTLIHAGTKLYLYGDTPTVVLTGVNNAKSMSTQVAGKLYIFTGTDLLVYDGTTVKSISEVAYVPVTTVGKSPSGGGTTLEPLNLIGTKRTEKFLGDNSSLVYQLGSTAIDADLVTIQSLNAQGGLDPLTEGTDFTVNRTLGTVTFTTVKPTPDSGVDNLYITYAKTIEGYANKIKTCDICVLFGVNGARDRVFCAGNPTLINYDWYCKSNDPTMWGDTWYLLTGQDDSAIIGYSIVNDNLTIHKNSKNPDCNAIIRTGNFDESLGEIVFKTYGNYAAAGALGKHTFINISNEPLYLTTEKNIQAITSNDIIGEKISQERSFFISDALAKEPNIEEAYACLFEGFYMLAVGNKMYILDSTQIVYEKETPYSTRQYECYVWDHIGARVLAVIDGRLFFGTEDGKVKRFYNDDLAAHFTDDGIVTNETVQIDGNAVTTQKSYDCYWETSEIYGSKKELKKTFKRLAICLNAYTHTGCRVWVKVNGIWSVIFDYNSSANFFDFSDFDFRDISFRTDSTPTLIGGKFKAKKVLHIQFRFENSKPQPFSVLWAVAKYTIGNEYVK